MNYKHLLRLIGRSIAFGCLSTWLIIFTMALLFSNDRAVRVTIRADVFHEFWFEFGLLIVGMIGWIYDYYCRKRMEDSKTVRKEDTEIKEPSAE